MNFPDSFFIDGEVILRISLACLAGFILGLERERHGRAAGLRTTMLVSLAGCLLMLLSEYYYMETFALGAFAENSWRPDPTRLIAGALSGMGFLGAGVIIHERNNIVRGVTTAATLWIGSAIGACFGGGLIGIGALCTLIAFSILFFLSWLDHLIEEDWFADFVVKLDSGQEVLDRVIAELEKERISVRGLDLRIQPGESVQVASLHMKYKNTEIKDRGAAITRRISALPGVLEVHWKG